jgi:polysaccharide export outer membrane protein
MIARTLTARGLCAFVALAPWLSGCQSASKHNRVNEPQLGVIDPGQPKELDMVSLPPYVVEPPDELEIAVRPAVAQLEETRTAVQSDGNLDLGFAGDVYVAGLTLAQIEQKIAQHLQALPLAEGERDRKRIEVSVKLSNASRSKYYYVLGTVSTQGRFTVTGNDTALDAILQAGLKSNSQPEKAYLVRPHPNGGADQVYKIDWCAITKRGDTLTNYQIFPGDRIYVPGGKPPSLLSTLIGGG